MKCETRDRWKARKKDIPRLLLSRVSRAPRLPPASLRAFLSYFPLYSQVTKEIGDV